MFVNNGFASHSEASAGKSANVSIGDVRSAASSADANSAGVW